MKTCGTCKYKGKLCTTFREGEEVDTSFFLCSRIPFKDSSEGVLSPGTKAELIDGSGYYAALCVEDDFGCVLWEAV